MILVNYGINQIDLDLMEIPVEVDCVNKLKGGLWACPEREWYSDWFVLTLYMPFLVSPNTTMGVNYLEIDSKASVLTLDVDNYLDFLDRDKLDLDKLCQYDVLHFTDDLVSEVDLFDGYYVESYQILNPNVIKNIERVPVNISIVFDTAFRTQSERVFLGMVDRVKQSRFFQELIQS